eukprot:1161409-Pelagomonas_calceolata.AAC.1
MHEFPPSTSACGSLAAVMEEGPCIRSLLCACHKASVASAVVVLNGQGKENPGVSGLAITASSSGYESSRTSLERTPWKALHLLVFDGLACIPSGNAQGTDRDKRLLSLCRAAAYLRRCLRWNCFLRDELLHA